MTSLGRPAVSRTDRVAAFDALELPDDRDLSRATLLRAAQLMGVRELVTGTVKLTGETLTVSVHVIQVEAGRSSPEIRGRGRLARWWPSRDASGAIAGAPPARARGRPLPSLEVFEAFVKGLVAETPATQLRFLEQAVKAAPAYARAHLAIWEVCTDEEQHARALGPRRPYPRHRASAAGRVSPPACR